MLQGATKRINGGYIGLEDREKHWDKAHAMGQAMLGGHWEPAAMVTLTQNNFVYGVKRSGRRQ